MSEVLKLEFHASTNAFIVTLDRVEELPDGKKRVVIGKPGPTERYTLAELSALDAQLATDLRSVLDRLEPIARAKAFEIVTDPVKLQTAANLLAEQRQAFEIEKASFEAQKAAR